MDDYDEDEYSDEEPPVPRNERSYIGSGLGEFGIVDNYYEDCDLRHIVESEIEGFRFQKVTWLSERAENVPSNKLGVEAAFVRYGNEASVGTIYSAAAIIVKLLPARERRI